METKILINKFFNKETGITHEDLKVKILGNLNENSLVEYKRIDNLHKEVTGIEVINLIMDTLTAFLNKITSDGGVLLLGICAKNKIPTDIVGVDEKIIRNSAALQSLITNNLSCVPPSFHFPDIEIETVPVDRFKAVYLIEVHPWDLNVLYFNKSNDTAHVREIDTTRRLTLDECARMIQTKRIAKLFVQLESKLKIEGEFVTHTVKVVFSNRGNKPAKHILSLFLFNNNVKDDKSNDIEIRFIGTKNISEATDLNACIKTYQQNYNELCYPKRQTVVGRFTIKFLRISPKHLDLEVDEENGRTSQSFIFTEKELIRETEAFSPY
jgi:hypothetical protein